MTQYLTRQQSIDWFKENRDVVIKKLSDQSIGKIKLKCPLCEALGEFTIMPDFDNPGSKYKVTFYCAECGFRIDDTGLKSFPPPPPPKHLRHKRKKNKISLTEIAGTLLLTISACVVYGIIHDQFTVRICIEYFTIAHPTIIESQSPIMLALAWGVVATWWVGLYLAIPLYFISFRGPWPKRTIPSLIKPIIILMLICGICAAITGSIGYWMAETNRIHLDEFWSQAIPKHQHSRFLAVWLTHNASYYTGYAGGIIIMIIILIKRIKAGKKNKR